MSKAIFGKGADSPLDGEAKYEGEIRYVAAGGEWFVVFHGEVAPTAEECGSFEKLIKLYENNLSDHQILSDSSYALQTLVKSEYCPADVLHQIAGKNIAMVPIMAPNNCPEMPNSCKAIALQNVAMLKTGPGMACTKPTPAINSLAVKKCLISTN